MRGIRPVQCHSRDEHGRVRIYDAAFETINGVVLDSCNPLIITGAPHNNLHNYFATLTTLAIGLEHLFFQHQSYKNHYLTNQDPIWGNSTGTWEIAPHPVLSCMFHWYAVTAWNYIRGIGYLAESLGLLHSGERGIHYARRAFPDLGSFRDKMGAHTSAFSDNPRDTLADKFTSLNVGMTCFAQNTFVFPAGIFGFGTSPDGSSTITPWSLEKTHLSLYSRYWSRPGEVDGVGSANAVTRIVCPAMAFSFQMPG